MSSLRARRIARNPFAFPGGNPRFNPAHPAAQGAYASFTASLPKVMVDVLKPVAPASNTISASSILGSIGPCLNNTTNFQEITFTGYPTTGGNYTKGWIGQFTAVSSPQYVFGDGATVAGGFTGGGNLGVTSAGLVTIQNRGVANFNSTVTLLANVPYFIAFSERSGVSGCNLVVLRLDTGSLQAQSFATNTIAITAPTGTISLGNASNACKMYHAAAMASNCVLSLPQLVQWAADPWSYWYPQ